MNALTDIILLNMFARADPQVMLMISILLWTRACRLTVDQELWLDMGVDE